MTNSLIISQPDDWHLHLRDDAMLKITVPASAKTFYRAIVMPNLSPPIVTVAQALDYKSRIIKHIPNESNFTPLMTLYLTDNTKNEDIISASINDAIIACKLYPRGATTNAESGVTDITKIYHLFELMEQHQIPLLIHAEVTDDDIDIFDREAVFIERYLIAIIKNFPQLKIVMEHITTKNAVDFISEQPGNIAATITAHHLLYNRNHMLANGIRPHYYCLPILKRSKHQHALISAATSGNKKFFLGTDSAPHNLAAKQSCCGCAGCFTAYAAIELYAEAFFKENKLAMLEAFASLNGADFYNLPRNQQLIKLTQKPWVMPEYLEHKNNKIKLLGANDTWQWQVEIV